MPSRVVPHHTESRNRTHQQHLRSKVKNVYYESFLPSSVRAWNSLPSEVRQLESLNSFKHFLNKDKVPVPKYYYTGKRKVQILHTRLRTRCSSLNLDLFIKNVSDSPMCTCGSIEDTQHFFFHCTNFTQQRVELFFFFFFFFFFFLLLF